MLTAKVESEGRRYRERALKYSESSAKFLLDPDSKP
ncbi:hypothetical protein M8C21_025173 [Ambrosia artemisiifolia]|uniref:Uncharacterized protein n=1 Tax=Ambrosia artemisiifolia TaxID=4212 RepID=A0AAD5BNZ9_AMBAR|nr:hypothetical protein M8C21_025173 [Ambrosia artemisiifolia]